MSPITHFLISWLVADRIVESDRDKGLIALAGVAPDLDGAGAVIDIANSWLGRPESSYYEIGHHWWLHGILGCLLVAGCAAGFGVTRWKVFLASLLTAHLHLLCDIAGSRGPGPTDFWTIFYLGPLSRRGELGWSGQWRLDSWQNVSLTLLALLAILRGAWLRGRSPLSLLSSSANAALTQTLRLRFGLPRSVPGPP